VLLLKRRPVEARQLGVRPARRLGVALVAAAEEQARFEQARIDELRAAGLRGARRFARQRERIPAPELELAQGEAMGVADGDS
jgi:hypothetical protein